MYQFKQLAAVKRVMSERRGPDKRYMSGWRYKRTAPVICGVIAKHNLTSFIEVGALGCQLSEVVLIEFPDIQVWSIDRHFKDIDHKGVLVSAPIERMKEQFGDRYNAVQAYSPQAAAAFQNKSIDMVYIDANHSYRAVLDDICGWWPKVTDKGVLGGHDYGMGPQTGVQKAVNEVFHRRSFLVGDFYNWWTVKATAKIKAHL